MRLTPEQEQTIADRVRAGETFIEISRDYGVTRQWIRKVALNRGVKSVRSFKRDYGHVDKARILKLYKSGMPFAHIGRTVGCNEVAAREISRRYGGYNPSPQHAPWTARDAAVVRKLYKTPGWSAARIAMKLGRTRDEVIGKAYRLKQENVLRERRGLRGRSAGATSQGVVGTASRPMR